MLCARCGKVPPEPGKKRCPDCLAYVRGTVARAYRSRKERDNQPGKPGRPRKELPIL